MQMWASAFTARHPAGFIRLARGGGFAHPDPMKKLAPALSSQPVGDEPLAEIEVMIARLRKLKDHERDTRFVGAYRAAIERLEGLGYRLRVKPETRVIGLPVKQTAPPPAPERPQRTLPLGPVPVRIVKAKKPKPRY
jgi:hypothetical protein